MADCVETDSDSSSSDISSLAVPSRKCKKSTDKKLRRKHHEVSRKTKEKKKKKKSRKRRNVTSGASFLSHDSTESEGSDREVRQKKSKKHKVKIQASTKASSHNIEYDLFQENYSRLEDTLSVCINTTISKLFAKKLVSEDVLGQVITRQDSDRKKAQKVLYCVQLQIKGNPGKLRTLLEVLKEEPMFEDLTRDLKCDDLCPKMDVNFLKTDNFLSLYKAHLKDFYDRDSIARDDKLSILPSSKFIRLALVNKEKSIDHADPFSKSTLHGGVDQILATKTPLEMDALLASGSKFVLVEGTPGIGKSTLCWELCRNWNIFKSLQDFEIVLQLNLRERHVQNATSLHELFRHDSEEVSRSVADFVLKRRGGGVLFILDGFDEMPSSVVSNEDCLVMKLIRGLSLPRATCLVTSRPSALHNKESCFPQDYRHVEILGFTDDCKRQFAEEAFKSDPKILDRFKKFIFSNPIITSLMYIPVNCAIIAQIYKESPDVKVPKTMTQLYTLLVLVLIRRHLIQTERWTRQSKVPSSLESLPEDIKADLARVSEIAYNGLMKKDVQVMFTDEEIGENFQHLGLLNEAKEMYVSQGAVTHYSFLHLSIQEFLAAWYTSCITELIQKASVSHSKVYLRFLCGLHSSTLTFLTKQKCIFPFFRDFVACFYEAQQALDLNSPFLDFFLLTSPLDMYMFGYALVHLPLKWEVKVETSLDMLKSSIEDHAPDGKVLGTIAFLHNFNFHSLPKCLLKYIMGLHLSDCTAPAVSLMPHLNRIDLNYEYPLTSQDTILNLLKLKNLKTIVISLSCTHIAHESETLCVFFRSTSTVENIQIGHCGLLPPSAKKLNYYSHEPVHCSVLSCSSIRVFSSVHPFFILNHSSSLEEIDLYFLDNNFTFYSIMTSIMCVAYMAKSLSKIRMRCIFGFPPREACEAASLLHSSLQANPLLTIESNVFGVLLFHLNNLSRALRKDPDIACKNFRRSKSLYDINSQKFRAQDIRHMRTRISCKLSSRWDSSQRRHSCPDLLEMQSLHNMHPQLQKAIGTEKCYFC